MNIRASDVFGIRTTVSEYSYIDRGNLDKSVRELADRDQHIALKGESKSGKSWLRQRIFTEANVIQCRINDTVADIYKQILANLNISVVTETSTSKTGTISFEGTAEIGWKFLAKAAGTLAADGEYTKERIVRPIGRDEMDIEFISQLILSSERKLVIEDFHYLSTAAQRQLAHELKTLWDYKVYAVIVGVWHRKNYLTYLNSDLAGRITEVGVEWSESELIDSFQKGCAALNIWVDPTLTTRAAQDSYNNVGILQSLALLFLDACQITEKQNTTVELLEKGKLDDAGMAYAEQLEAVYSLFAERVSEGIRKRKDATQIYAFALWTILGSSDEEAKNGLTVDWIYERAHSRQSRIQKPNLRAVLRKFKELQVDDRGKGIVLSYDEANDTVLLIDKGVLFYRKYTTQVWPWERIAMEAKEKDVGISDDPEAA
ncbi:hypothetical protein [Brucella anthropi]|uniref:hypothetical protein n=1 Tax=Brucella anthropi TaxID=529 RepID=UPI00125E6A96|nr:hypothetical protein [Brucella anthropi]QFP61912.1 hypothetical protein FT787_01705 [Brucella anthropi]